MSKPKRHAHPPQPQYGEQGAPNVATQPSHKLSGPVQSHDTPQRFGVFVDEKPVRRRLNPVPGYDPFQAPAPTPSSAHNEEDVYDGPEHFAQFAWQNDEGDPTAPISLEAVQKAIEQTPHLRAYRDRMLAQAPHTPNPFQAPNTPAQRAHPDPPPQHTAVYIDPAPAPASNLYTRPEPTTPFVDLSKPASSLPGLGEVSYTPPPQAPRTDQELNAWETDALKRTIPVPVIIGGVVFVLCVGLVLALLLKG